MPVHPRDGGHGKGQKTAVQRPQRVGPERLAHAHGVRQVQAVGIEFGQGGCRHHATRRQARELDEVERGEEGLAEGGGLSIVRWRGDGEQVDLGRGFGDGDGAALVVVTWGDWHGKERLAQGKWGCHGRMVG